VIGILSAKRPARYPDGVEPTPSRPASMPLPAVPLRRLAPAVAVVLLAAAAQACSIPVFRYALERWRPDPYEVLVYHRGELTHEQHEVLARLHPEYVPGEPTPNASVTRVDLDAQVRPEFAAIWEADGGEALPWIVLRTPWKGENFTVWKGPLAAESVDAVLSSPVRAEVIRRLAGGDSVVWVFLAGADAAESDRLAETARSQLAALEGGIQLPEIRPEDLTSLSVDPASLGLKFSFLRLKPDDPREQLMVRSMLAVKPGLAEAAAAGEPMLYPVFGRGRIFFPLVGSDIQPINLEDLARFLCGACQCTIKEQNPGLDLLTNVDWDAYVLGIPTEKPLPPLAGLGDFAVPEIPSTALTATTATTDAPPPEPSLSEPSAPRSTVTPAPAAPTRPASADPGGLALWMIGLLTGAVAIASLWLRPRH
jgi:hypothetical protein